ncbi:sensor histidine kinase [Delftia acidovorans]|uniref:sensor histidine kinase n=1 Tax=Delftia acidovorans TaxID=80866 RepID=UPI001E633C43|nr:histidine kinase [Delftia acidovorans]
MSADERRLSRGLTGQPLQRRALLVSAGLAALAMLLAGAFGLRGDAAGVPVQLRQAQLWASPSQRWEPPVALEAADDAVLGAATPWREVDLPYAGDRAVSGSGDLALAPPEVRWFRAVVPPGALAPTPQGARLYIPRWQTVGTVAVYVDGKLAWQTRGSRVWNSFNRPVWLDLGGLAQPGRPLQVHVRMAGQQGVGGALSSLWAGPAESLRLSWRLRSLLQADLVVYTAGSYLVLGLFALALWTLQRRRGDVVFLLFFLMSLCQLLGSLQFMVDGEGLALSDGWFSWLTLAGLMGATVAAFHFLCLMQRRRRPWLGRVLQGYVGTVLLVAVPLWGPAHETILPLLRLLMVPPEILVLCMAVVGAWRMRDGGSTMLAVWMLLSFPIGFHDLALQSYLISIESIYLTPYVYLGLFTLFLLVAYRRYNGALAVAENANLHLAERLKAQEAELAQAHERLLAVEREQTLMQERQRLMREMHDGVGSSLMSALRVVEFNQAGTVDLVQLLQECIDDLKLSIDSLEPLDCDLLALLAGLRYRLGPRLEGAGLRLHWEVSDLPALPWLDAQAALHVLRILQEVLTNIIKHSGAREIRVRTAQVLLDGRAGVQVLVGDDGHPFDRAQAPTEGRKGLVNMRTRALALQALLDWEPLAGGNRFTLWMPLERAGA